MANTTIRMTPAYLQILLSIAEGETHGYGIMKDIAARTGGAMELGPGSLYWSLKRLRDAGLVTERAGGSESETRRDYRLTAEGRRRLRAELEQLAGIVSRGRKLKLL